MLQWQRMSERACRWNRGSYQRQKMCHSCGRGKYAAILAYAGEHGGSGFFDSVAAKVLRDMREIIFLGRTPYLSLSLLWVRERELHYYSVGSNQIFLYNGMDYQLMKRGFDTVAFEKGMTAGLVSCGVWEALNEKEMVSYLMKKEHPYDKAQHMIAGVREKIKKRQKQRPLY